MKTKFLLFLSALMLTATRAKADDSGTIAGEDIAWNYVDATKTLTITYTGSASSKAMPDIESSKDWDKTTVREVAEHVVIGDKISSIGNNAFRGFQKLQDVTFPATGFTGGFGSYCFYNCQCLTAINIPSTATGAIGWLAFNACKALTAVTIPVGITTIDTDAFSSCTSLATVTISAGSALATINLRAFNKCSALAAIHLEDCASLTTIGEDAFAYCTSLTSLTLPASVTSIGGGWVYGCSALLYVDMSAITKTDLVSESNFGSNKMFPYSAMYYLVYLPQGNAKIERNNVVYYEESKWKCSMFSASDEHPVTVPREFTAARCNYYRSLGADGTYTICLPFNPTAETGVTYYKLSGVSGSTLTFTEEAAPEPNKPYLITTTGTVSSFDTWKVGALVIPVTPASMNTAVSGYKMVGTLRDISRADAITLGAYILQTGNIWQQMTDAAAASSNIPSFRTYIVADGGGARSLDMNLGQDNGVTAVENIRTIDRNGNEQWYDINGRHISNPTKGLYIKNGRKVIIK